MVAPKTIQTVADKRPQEPAPPQPETRVDAEAILLEILGPSSRCFEIVRRHGEQVARRALKAAGGLVGRRPDEGFLYEAALLHDIGIYLTDTPQLGCHGPHPYILHGILGRRLLEARGLPRHALVCERHVGVGITTEEIRKRSLPLPLRDMRPVSVEEILICYADKFYSKAGDRLTAERTFPEVARKLERYGRRQTETFIRWAERFEGLVLDQDDRPK
jgi:uncharacterized protein